MFINPKTMMIRFFMLLLAFSSFASASAQSNCWPQCGSNTEITLAFRMRRPTFTVSGSDECREEVRKMVEAFDREDQNITNFARTACAALIGWVETDPGSCMYGGPLCCTKKPSHWVRDASAWARFTAAQIKIGNQRRTQVENYLKMCNFSAKVSTTNEPPASSAVSGTANNSSQPKVNIQQMGNNLNKMATQNMVSNFGKSATKSETSIRKPIQSNASTSIDEPTLIDRKVFNQNSTSLDDVVSDLTQLLVKKTADSIANKDNLTMKGYRQSAAWIKMRDKAYQQFLAEVEKDPELKKKGSKMVTLPTGELILFETPEAIERRKKIPIRYRSAVMGVRG